MIEAFLVRHAWPLIAVGVLVVAIGTAVLWIRHDAAEGVREDIEEKNDAAGDAGDAAALGRRECVRSGGVWRFEAGECARAN